MLLHLTACRTTHLYQWIHRAGSFVTMSPNSTPPWTETVERWRIPQLAFAMAIPFNAWAKGSLNDSGALTAVLFAVITLVLSPTLVFAW